MSLNPTPVWTEAVNPVRITFSHENHETLAEAHFRVTAVLRAKKIGATLTSHTGFWQGAAEPGWSVELLDASFENVQRLTAAAISGGCEAIQVERFPTRIAQEYRA